MNLKTRLAVLGGILASGAAVYYGLKNLPDRELSVPRYINEETHSPIVQSVADIITGKDVPELIVQGLDFHAPVFGKNKTLDVIVIGSLITNPELNPEFDLSSPTARQDYLEKSKNLFKKGHPNLIVYMRRDFAEKYAQNSSLQAKLASEIGINALGGWFTMSENEEKILDSTLEYQIFLPVEHFLRAAEVCPGYLLPKLDSRYERFREEFNKKVMEADPDFRQDIKK